METRLFLLLCACVCVCWCGNSSLRFVPCSCCSQVAAQTSINNRCYWSALSLWCVPVRLHGLEHQVTYLCSCTQKFFSSLLMRSSLRIILFMLSELKSSFCKGADCFWSKSKDLKKKKKKMCMWQKLLRLVCIWMSVLCNCQLNISRVMIIYCRYSAWTANALS